MQIEQHAHNLTAVAAVADARGSDAVAAAIGVYGDAVKREAAISALTAGIGRLHDDTRTLQRTALLDVVLAAAKDAVRPAYIEKFVDQLQDAGLTSAIKRGLSREQMGAIREILGAPKKEPGPRGSRQKAVARIDIPPPTQSPWRDLADQIPSYSYTLRLADRADPGDMAILDAALPPMVSIEAYRPGAAVVLISLPTNTVKARFAWDTMDVWLKIHHPSRNEVRLARRLAWTFLLGQAHGFSTDMKGFEEVRFASPWQVNQIVLATRNDD